MDSPPRLLGAFAAALLVAALARRRRALSRSGAAAAVLVGTAVVAGAGWWAGVALVSFFATSSALSRIGRGGRSSGIVVRGDERDVVQVLANGGLPALLALAAPVVPVENRDALFAAFAGAVAAVTADTWATEIGSSSATVPRLLLAGPPVPPGTSGGMTPLGSLAAAAGAALIAVVAAFGVAADWAPGSWDAVLAGTIAAGVVGSSADSALGATLQASYRCPACDRPTERRVHGCGAPTALVRGHPAVTNDAVNAFATVAGAMVGSAATVFVA